MNTQAQIDALSREQLEGGILVLRNVLFDGDEGAATTAVMDLLYERFGDAAPLMLFLEGDAQIDTLDTDAAIALRDALVAKHGTGVIAIEPDADADADAGEPW